MVILLFIRIKYDIYERDKYVSRRDLSFILLMVPEMFF